MINLSRGITEALAESLQDAPLLPQDAATVRLAERYAAALDTGDEEVLDRLGPKLLATLTALGLNPAGRGVKGGSSAPAVGSKLDELRDRRARRAGQHDA